MEREEAIRRVKAWNLDSDDREVLETLIPELAESEDEESEDEKTRKFLIQHISEWIGCIEHDLKYSSKDIESEKELAMFKAGLAWLEKQKEKLGDISTILLVKKEIERRIETWQKSRKELIAMECNTLADDAAVRIEELYSLISFLGTIRCNTNERQKEQKPLTDEEKEYIRTIKSIISDFIRDKKPENLAYYQRIYDWLDGRHVPFSCGHENGKPLDNWKPSEEQMEEGNPCVHGSGWT